jgi:hypothetical protein
MFPRRCLSIEIRTAVNFTSSLNWNTILQFVYVDIPSFASQGLISPEVVLQHQGLSPRSKRPVLCLIQPGNAKGLYRGITDEPEHSAVLRPGRSRWFGGFCRSGGDGVGAAAAAGDSLLPELRRAAMENTKDKAKKTRTAFFKNSLPI